MKAREIMTSHPVSCQPNDKLCEAINIMKEHNYTVVPVTDGAQGNRLVGIVTGRDIALEMGAQEKTCKDLNVETCMRKPVYSCHPDDDIKKVEQLMKEHKLEYIAVTDQNGDMEGIVFLADLAREVYREKKEGRHDIPEEDLAEVVEVIASESSS